ncbi:Cation efflux system protein CusC precursor [Posidoniimonas polymericola]|uniref:Cation efflux system protein CusC n=1 Tax=Posidoniimonas polymericola TaxID=2528002 RepID=A0A5C5YTF8_9BACT|nr:TolC family protein [Posidoniimonas polymericola]TWT78238.1 Cation efflux system protein CusC precursor [Posidoniimonas polymericola]
MTPSASYSSDTRSSRLLPAIVIACLLLSAPSCCIPDLCCAKKGPAMPGDYNGRVDPDNSANIGWCEFFDDPALTDLICQAMNGNQELRILEQEVRIASLEAYGLSGEYLPFVTFGAGAGIEKSSRFTREGAVEDQLTVAPGKPFPEPLPDFLVATNILWELDIWKKLRNAQSAAAYRYLATRDGRNYVVTRVVAEVAENYYELLALDNRMETLERTIEIQQQSLENAKSMKEAARGTELAVQRFQAEVRKNESERAIIRQEILEAENRINFLVGRYPQPVERMSVEYVDLNLHALAVGVPSDLLLNRPDIRQAEKELCAAGLDVKVARARFYPSVTLRAGVGYQAFNTRYLFTSPESLIYNAAGDLIAPVINRKAIKADYLSANAKQLQAVYNYQRTVLNAFTEVINQVSKVENYRESIAFKKQQLEAMEASVVSANNLFQNARAEYVEVLLAQREMMEAKMTLIDTKRQQLAAVVNAYQALGGGGGPGVRVLPAPPSATPSPAPAGDGLLLNPSEPPLEIGSTPRPEQGGAEFGGLAPAAARSDNAVHTWQAARQHAGLLPDAEHRLEVRSDMRRDGLRRQLAGDRGFRCERPTLFDPVS